MRIRMSGASPLLLLLCVCSIARAEVPRVISLQGVLRDRSGAPLADGKYPAVFRLYDAEAGGTPLWREPATGTEEVVVSGGHGVFSALLGKLTAFSSAGTPIAFNKPLWLGVQVGTDPEMAPRLPLASAPYALGVPMAGTGTAPTSSHSDHTHFGSAWTGSAPLGLSVTNSQAAGFPSGLKGVVTGPGTGVHGQATASSGDTYGVYGEASSASGTGVAGVGAHGVNGSTFQANGIGVYGRGQSPDGATVGVQGETSSPQGIGVYGVHGASGNYGEVGTSGSGIYGFGQTGPAVYGQSSTQRGVSGVTTAANTAGVFGESDNGSDAYGVYGFSLSGVGVAGAGPKGILGISTTVSGNFGSLGTNFTGVEGHSSNGAGVYGESANFGVQGHNTATGSYAYLCTTDYAGDFYGNVDVRGDLNVTGTLTKAAGSFKIDDPIDPAHRTLSHSFVESPDMMDIYNGNVTTDASGEAVITLPAWFEALNRDFRYQLTCIGQFAQAIVSEEIRDNRFAVRTDKPNVKVSWQVTGIRHDAYANAHRIPVEEWKAAASP